MLHTYTPKQCLYQCPYQVSTTCTLWFLRKCLDKIYKVKVTTIRSNQSHSMTLYTYTPNQCPHQVSTFYTLWFWRYNLDKIFKLVVPMARLKVKSRSHHDVAYLHPQPMSLLCFSFLHLTVSRIQPGQTFSRHLTTRPPIQMPWVKTIPTQPLRVVG